MKFEITVRFFPHQVQISASEEVEWCSYEDWKEIYEAWQQSGLLLTDTRSFSEKEDLFVAQIVLDI